MINIIKSLWRSLQSPKIYLDVTLDHVELSDNHLVIGLDLCWQNKTTTPVSVKEVRLKVFLKGRKSNSIDFAPHGHFKRKPGQKVITKTFETKLFDLPARKFHEEHIRFYNSDILNLDEATYPVEIHVQVPGGTYIHQAKLAVINRLKYRTSEEWTEEKALP